LWPGDITDQRQAAPAVESVVSELGRLDTVVNNAGTMGVGPAVDSPLEEWERMVAINVQGLLYVTHAALPHLLRPRRARRGRWRTWSTSAQPRVG
jgi:NADP-dependent 3-hydroxy acid dehydrogenase YdfG